MKIKKKSKTFLLTTQYIDQKKMLLVGSIFTISKTSLLLDEFSAQYYFITCHALQDIVSGRKLADYQVLVEYQLGISARLVIYNDA